ncbi:unnamed protein product, partial [Ixodes pacificus]
QSQQTAWSRPLGPAVWYRAPGCVYCVLVCGLSIFAGRRRDPRGGAAAEVDAVVARFSVGSRQFAEASVVGSRGAARRRRFRSLVFLSGTSTSDRQDRDVRRRDASAPAT